MDVVTAAALDAPRLRHGFFTRHGGVSQGIYASLNCGYGSSDARDSVTTNRTRALDFLGFAVQTLVTVHQQHTNTVVTVDAGWPVESRPVADGMVTAQPGFVLGILTADCAPVLFVDAEAGVVGAAHAGWRGALGGVLDGTVGAMTALGARPERIRAAVGPCIGQNSYQVGPDFAAAFTAPDSGNARFFSPPDADDRPHFDLAGYVAHRLTRAGVGHVEMAALDTCGEEDRFFSFRRTTLRREFDYGRQLSAIALAK